MYIRESNVLRYKPNNQKKKKKNREFERNLNVLWYETVVRMKSPSMLVHNRELESDDERFLSCVLIENKLHWHHHRIMFGKIEELIHDQCLTNIFKCFDYRKKNNFILNRFGPSSRQTEIVNVASSSKNSLANESHHWLSHSWLTNKTTIILRFQNKLFKQTSVLIDKRLLRSCIRYSGDGIGGGTDGLKRKDFTFESIYFSLLNLPKLSHMLWSK